MYIGEKYLVTTNEWFFAPDGRRYKAVLGTVKKMISDDKISIGCMYINKYEVKYIIRTDICNLGESVTDIEHNGSMNTCTVASRIYDADQNG